MRPKLRLFLAFANEHDTLKWESSHLVEAVGRIFSRAIFGRTANGYKKKFAFRIKLDTRLVFLDWQNIQKSIV